MVMEGTHVELVARFTAPSVTQSHVRSPQIEVSSLGDRYQASSATLRQINKTSGQLPAGTLLKLTFTTICMTFKAILK